MIGPGPRTINFDATSLETANRTTETTKKENLNNDQVKDQKQSENKTFNERPMDEVDDDMERLFADMLAGGDAAEKAILDEEKAIGESKIVSLENHQIVILTQQHIETRTTEATEHKGIKEENETEATQLSEVKVDVQQEESLVQEEVVATVAVKTEVTQETQVDKSIIHALHGVEVTDQQSINDVKGSLHTVELVDGSPKIVSGGETSSIEEMRQKCKEGKIAVVDLKNKNLWVSKEMAKKMGPTFDFVNAKTGETHRLNVQVLNEDDINKIIGTLDRCSIKQNQINQIAQRQEPKSDIEREQANGTLSITATQKKETPTHTRVAEMETHVQNPYSQPVSALFDLRCQVVSNRTAERKHQEKEDEIRHHKSELAVKKDEKYWERVFDNVHADISENNIKEGNLLYDLKNVLTPIYHWRADSVEKEAQVIDGFKNAMDKAGGVDAAQDLVVTLEKMPKPPTPTNDDRYVVAKVFATRSRVILSTLGSAR